MPFASDRPRRAGGRIVTRDRGEERNALDPQEFGVVRGDDGRCPWPVGEQGDLPEALSSGHRANVFAALGDVDVAADDGVIAVSDLALTDDSVTAGNGEFRRGASDGLQLRTGQMGEDAHPTQEPD